MKICFWGDISSAITGKTSGGSELQAALLAKLLKKAGHEIIVVDFQVTGDFVTKDGIIIKRINGWNNGLKFLRILTHRIPGLYRTLREQNADVYYCRMRDFNHFLAYRAARKAGSKFVFALASDLDAAGFFMRLKYYYLPNRGGLWWLFNGILNELSHPWLLRHADMVLAQHEGQREVLSRKKINSILLGNLIDLASLPSVKNPRHEYFIYVGWLDKRKGIVDFYKVVNSAPKHKFIVIGPPRDKIGRLYYDKLKSLNNVTLLGEMSHRDTLVQIANSKALISTSPMEGFPNIFIEAWAYGIPVLSLYFDPGNIISKQGLGGVAKGNMESFIESIDKIQYNDLFAKHTKEYVEAHHAVNELKIAQVSKLLGDVIKIDESALRRVMELTNVGKE